MRTLEFFTLDEFLCPCCGKGDVEMDAEFLTTLDLARHFADLPFMITSGFRCRDHNSNIGGSQDSAHLSGFAADIYTAGPKSRYRIVAGLIQAGFRRIGIGDNFIHADSDPGKARGAIWTYGHGGQQ